MTQAEQNLFALVMEAEFQDREAARLEAERPYLDAAEYVQRLDAKRRQEYYEEQARILRQKKREQFPAFLEEYEALCRKHGVIVESAGWNGHLGLVLVEKPNDVFCHLLELRVFVEEEPDDESALVLVSAGGGE